MSRFWRHFVSNGHASFVEDHLGVAGQPVRVGPERGLKVRLVRPESPAEVAGLQPGDVLLSLADRPTTSLAAVDRLLLDLPVGVPFCAVWQRQGRRLERWLILAEHPAPLPRSTWE